MQKNKRKIYLLLISLLYLFAPVKLALAQTEPSFPLCTAPSGSLVANYESGTHGIVGSTSSYEGADKVFQVSDDKWLQCFCPSTGSQGIQTNWWKTGTLNEQEINTYKAKGWLYVPTGAVWGLSDSPYLAKNTNYNCRTSQSSGSTNSTSSTSTSTGGPSVLGMAAATGTKTKMVSLALLGLILMTIGIIKTRKTSNVR